MSTIVVVKKANKAVIAADTQTTFGTTKCGGKYISNKDKILTFATNYIGIVGSSAHSNVWQSIIRNYAAQLSFESLEAIFDTYVGLHPILKEKYFINAEQGKDDEAEYETSQIDALIANSAGIFGMYSWREVFEYERFWAIGSGRPFALGAMSAVYDQLASPEEIAEIGIKAACEFDSCSSLPMTLYVVDLQKEVVAPANLVAGANLEVRETSSEGGG